MRENTKNMNVNTRKLIRFSLFSFLKTNIFQLYSIPCNQLWYFLEFLDSHAQCSIIIPLLYSRIVDILCCVSDLNMY